MTELEEAELTDGQARALSAHNSPAYERYAKRTMERALAARIGSRAVYAIAKSHPPPPYGTVGKRLSSAS